MKKRLLLLLLFAGSYAMAQKKSAPNPQPYATTISEADLKKQLYIIAGKEMEGRETATEGQRKAAAYIESEFRRLGLLPGNQGHYQLAFPVYRDSLLGASMIANGQEFELNTDFQPIIQLNNSSTQFFSEVVFAGHGIVDEGMDDYKDLDVKGKAVLVLEGGPSSFKPTKSGWQSPVGTFAKINNARSKGAAAILMVGTGFPRKAMNSLGNMYTELYKEEQGPAVYFVSDKVAQALVGEGWNAVRDGGKKEKAASSLHKKNLMFDFRKNVQFLESTNVLGIIEGTDKKDEYLVLTAHYDHLGKRGDVIYYGADDDGSGTVSVLEIAEAFAKAKAEGRGPRRSVIFMTVSGEEKGLWGSEYFSNHPTVTLEKVTANLNIDMIGRIDTERNTADTLNYVYVVGDDKLSTDLKPISEAVNKKNTKLILDYKFNDPADKERIYFRSDHYNFARKGVPIIFYYDGMLKADYHQPTDTPDKINYPLLAKRAQLVFFTAWEMANREAMLKRDIPLPALN
jgi:hypothetical protein